MMRLDIIKGLLKVLLDLHYPNPKFSICFYFDSIFACVFLMEH